MGGNITEEQKQKADAKKAEDDGEPKKLSKAELNKLKKKEQRANAKAAVKGGGEAPGEQKGAGKKAAKEEEKV